MRERLRLHENVICGGIYAGLLLYAVLTGTWSLSGMGETEGIHAAAALVSLGVLAAASLLPVRGRLLVFLSVAVSLTVVIAAAGMENAAAFLQAGVGWLTGDGGELPQGWTSCYELLLVVCLAVLCWSAECFLEKFPAIRPAVAFLLAAVLTACLFLREDPGHRSVVCAIGYIAAACAEWTQGRWKKVQRGGRQSYMLRIMPFLLIYVMFMSLMPMSESPYEWQWAQNIYARMRERVLLFAQSIKWGEREGFDEGLAGFSSSGALRGSVEENPREVMTVEMRSGAMTNVYLTGRVYDSFDGRRWKQTYPGQFWDPFWDAEETSQAVNGYNGEYRLDYLRENVLRIRFRDFHTACLFAPLKTTAIQSGGKKPDYVPQGGDLRWSVQQGYGTEYEVRYYRMNTGKEAFDRFLEEVQRQEKEERESWKGQEPAYDSGYVREIYENYLGEIVLSDRVRAYLDEITEGAETDVQKLRAIERELSSYAYTKTPGELPGQISDAGGFLDYFLLESRSGYCSYFATAFVLLARAEGIPARYVQGFCVPVWERGEVSVYSDMAHAWPEAYIRGVGWIPFEPTPGYTALRHISWNMAQESDRSPDPDEQTEDRGDEGQEEFWQQEMQAQETETTKSAEWVIGRYARFLLRFVVLTVLILVGGVLLMDLVWYRRQYQRMSVGDKFRKKVWENLLILSWLGIRREEGETLQELRERAENTLQGIPGNASGDFSLGFLENYEKILYGGANAGEEMLEEAKAEERLLLCSLKGERKRTYIFYWIRWYLHCHSRSGKYN